MALRPHVRHHDPQLSSDLSRQIVLVCDGGYQSSLAAATLQDLGFTRATDLVGGFQAWVTAGLPVLHEATTGDGVRVRVLSAGT